MKLHTLLTYKQKTRLKWLDKIGDKFYEYREKETDQYIRESVDRQIGHINCLIQYDICPSDEDLEEILEYHNLVFLGEE